MPCCSRQARRQLLAARGVQIGMTIMARSFPWAPTTEPRRPRRRVGEKWGGESSFPLPSQLGDLEERCKLSQQGPGRSPVRN